MNADATPPGLASILAEGDEVGADYWDMQKRARERGHKRDAFDRAARAHFLGRGLSSQGEALEEEVLGLLRRGIPKDLVKTLVERHGVSGAAGKELFARALRRAGPIPAGGVAFWPPSGFQIGGLCLIAFAAVIFFATMDSAVGSGGKAILPVGLLAGGVALLTKR